MSNRAFNRILVKLSGEILAGTKGFGIEPEITTDLALKIKEVADKGIQIGIVIGGGNIIRGLSASSKGLDRVPGDYLGMLATIMNSVALNLPWKNLIVIQELCLRYPSLNWQNHTFEEKVFGI